MRKRMRVAICVILGLILMLTVCISPVSLETEREADVDSEVAANGSITRILVLGRDRAVGLTDSIFVVTVDAAAKRATILQIPRDTYANYTDRDYKKLNGAWNVLGADGVKALLGRALGVPIDYFVTLDLDCLQRVVDAIGGVDVEIPIAMEYRDPAQGLVISLPAGRNHLDGKGAEQLIRFRSGYVNADLGRLDAQKLFLAAFAKRCQSLSPAETLQVIALAITRVQTDISLPDAIRLMALLQSCDADDIPMATLAGEAVQGKSGAWYYVICRAVVCRMANEYLLPEIGLAVEEIDPDGLFDRPQNLDFHKIYIAPDKQTAGRSG